MVHNISLVSNEQMRRSTIVAFVERKLCATVSAPVNMEIKWLVLRAFWCQEGRSDTHTYVYGIKFANVIP